MVRSVILAAGASSRMGQPKAALPIGPGRQTFLSRITSTLIAAGLPEIIVVTGATPTFALERRRRLPTIAPEFGCATVGPTKRPELRLASPEVFGWRDRRVRVIENTRWKQGQLSSLLAGLDMPAVMPIEAALVMLVDVPLVSVETVQRLVRLWRETRAPIVRPARGDEHGHPVIFDASVFHELRSADPRSGAKPVVHGHAAEIVNVPIDDPGAYLDIDTPEAYAQLLRQAKPLR